jgi:hypothetical protein
MSKRKVLVYYAWSRPGENGAPLHVIEDRFPALFESRRMGFPRFHEYADPARFDQSIAGFLDHIMKPNFTAFVELATALTGQPVAEIERVADDGTLTPLDARTLDGIDTLIMISFDSLRAFLAQPDHLAFICPHHDIGDVEGVDENDTLRRQLAEFEHHGDKTIPPRQRFGGLARSLLAGLGVPVENRFGLRPRAEADGSPSPIEAETDIDWLGILQNVTSFNLHPHLPQLERLDEAVSKLDVLARQQIDLAAPPHPFALERSTFDALLQSREDTFGGTLLVSDTTLWSSTAGGVESLRQLWTNVVQRPLRS